MTASDTVTQAQRDITEATRAASAATTAAGKAVTSAAVRATRSTVDATVEAAKSVTAATNRAATDAAASASDPFGPAFGDTKRQVQEFVDTVTAQTKEFSLAWLDAYDSGFAAFLELGKTAAGALQVQALTSVAEFNSAALSEINATFSKAARELLQ